MVTGEVNLTDSTHLRANAANDKRETITVKHKPTEYMKKLDEAAFAEGMIKEAYVPKEKTAQQTKSLTGPDCGLLKRPVKPTGFYYLNHQTVDGASGIITDVYVTPANTIGHIHHTKRVKYQIDKFGCKNRDSFDASIPGWDNVCINIVFFISWRSGDILSKTRIVTTTLHINCINVLLG